LCKHTEHSLLLITPLIPVWFHIDTILVALKQPVAAAQLARRFLTIYVFAFPAMAFNETAIRFYRAQDVVLPFPVIMAIVLLLHPIWLHLFCIYGGLGFDGAPLAMCLSQYCNSVLILVLFNCFPRFHHPDSMPCFTRSSNGYNNGYRLSSDGSKRRSGSVDSSGSCESETDVGIEGIGALNSSGNGTGKKASSGSNLSHKGGASLDSFFWSLLRWRDCAKLLRLGLPGVY